jgi:uncharacterized membrane protein
MITVNILRARSSQLYCKIYLTLKNNIMKKNMGSFDRSFRLVIALVVILLHFIGVLSGTAAAILLVIAAVFALTSFTGVCPLYKPFGINTGAKEEKG